MGVGGGGVQLLQKGRGRRGVGRRGTGRSRAWASNPGAPTSSPESPLNFPCGQRQFPGMVFPSCSTHFYGFKKATHTGQWWWVIPLFLRLRLEAPGLPEARRTEGLLSLNTGPRWGWGGGGGQADSRNSPALPCLPGQLPLPSPPHAPSSSPAWPGRAGRGRLGPPTGVREALPGALHIQGPLLHPSSSPSSHLLPLLPLSPPPPTLSPSSHPLPPSTLCFFPPPLPLLLPPPPPTLSLPTPGDSDPPRAVDDGHSGVKACSPQLLLGYQTGPRVPIRRRARRPEKEEKSPGLRGGGVARPLLPFLCKRIYLPPHTGGAAGPFPVKPCSPALQ